MTEEQNVLNFYVLCNKLKDVVRTGWKNWNVKRERIESIAEHIYGTQMLAIAMWSEYKYDIDLSKVLSMLAIHELEETLIGDLTMFQIDRTSKERLGHEAVEKILSGLLKGESIKKLVFEFDKRETPEAKFAYWCDKLECDLQCKLYDEQNCVDLNEQESNEVANNTRVKENMQIEKSWSGMWIKLGQQKYNYDENFLKVSQFAKDNNLLVKDENFDF